MKFLATTALLAGSVAAFPYNMDQLVAPLADNAKFQKYKREQIEKRTADGTVEGVQVEARAAVASPQGAGALPLTPPPFDAAKQYVSNKGAHAFVAPTATDARGECPGLNAMANHGYLPHNGYATIQQFIDATELVFGMANDLGGFLAIFGALIDGDGSGWSIGGLPHTGILGSHGNYETDSSPLKSDLNQYGSNTRLIMSQFYNLYNRQPNAATANYNLEVLRDFRRDRFYESVNKNPYFTYNVFAGVEVSQAAFTFIYRFMSNKSAENPEGILNKATLKSFMAIEGNDENSLTHNPGHEKIPDNWYKRNPSDEYSIPYFEADILYFAETVPEVLEIGCNQGKVNTYNKIDPALLSNGAYTAQQFAKNPICFATEVAMVEAGPALGINVNQAPFAALFAQLKTLTAPLNCASIGSVNQSVFAPCPGLSAYGGPTGPVAPGAIQS